MRTRQPVHSISSIGSYRLNLLSRSTASLVRLAMFALPMMPGVQGIAPGATNDQCIVALNASANNALSVSGNVVVGAPNCGVVLNSSSTTALKISGSVNLTAKYINVTGGYSPAGAVSVSPAPVIHTPVLPTPLTFIHAPTSTHCDYTNFSASSGTPTLSPGTYCNGITIKGNTTATFSPGPYILMGGGLKVSGSATLNGTGVTFFLTQGLTYTYGPLSISGTTVLNLKAPESGPFYGILFHQDPSIAANQAGSTLTGSVSLTGEGVFYFPTTNLAWSGSASGNQSRYLILIADTVTLNGSLVLNANYPGGRSPLLPAVTVSVTPGIATVNAGLTQQFTAIVTNAVNPAVLWSVTPANTGTVSAAGLYTAPATVTGSQTITVTVASVEDPTKSASATVTLMPPVLVSVTPGSATLYAGQTRQLVASVANAANIAVTWAVVPAAAGTVSATGLYTAPATVATQQTVTVSAASQADPSKSASSTITLTPPVTVTVVSSVTTLYGGQSQGFSATVTNAANTAVTWAIAPAGSGSITAAGVYTAPAVVATTDGDADGCQCCRSFEVGDDCGDTGSPVRECRSIDCHPLFRADAAVHPHVGQQRRQPGDVVGDSGRRGDHLSGRPVHGSSGH